MKVECSVCGEEIIENFFYRRDDNYKAVGICCYNNFKDKDILFDVNRF